MFEESYTIHHRSTHCPIKQLHKSHFHSHKSTFQKLISGWSFLLIGTICRGHATKTIHNFTIKVQFENDTKSINFSFSCINLSRCVVLLLSLNQQTKNNERKRKKNYIFHKKSDVLLINQI
jgi:hypothetical protein